MAEQASLAAASVLPVCQVVAVAAVASLVVPVAVVVLQELPVA
jgi:hypothetical protein